MSPQLSLVVGLLVSSAVFGFCSAENILYTNDVLFGGQSLTNGNFRFTMQTDCNLVLYDGGSAIWSSGTYRKGTGCYVKMQSDGNLVVYNGSNNALWASNTDRGRGNYVCILQRDRNVVVYGPALWATGTNRVGTPGVIISANSTGTAAPEESNATPEIAMVINN
ncbi:mannose-specific lectin-like [Ananas comosus]|uniref:non-specific serine/threonine protein kinase n=1 Tax=Ananas comosus TaxID=4615 RepID=Q8H2A4_ANACO|nr:mannose-specific lectin-like [Ananas comosus]AAM28277.1 mannose-binding lectin [Ananas comosus]